MFDDDDDDDDDTQDLLHETVSHNTFEK